MIIVRLRYFILLVSLIVFIGLNAAAQGITSVVGDGPWQVTKLERHDDHIILILFGRNIVLSQSEVPIWFEEIREIVSMFINNDSK